MGLLLLLTVASARRAACLGPVPPARGLSLPRLRSGGGEAASPAGIWSLSAADLRIAGSAACGSYLQGYTTGVLGGSLLFLVPRFGLSPRAVGAVATATTLGSVVGSCVGRGEDVGRGVGLDVGRGDKVGRGVGQIRS